MIHGRSCFAISALAVWMASAAGCSSDDADEAAQLQALLHDEPLRQVPPDASMPTGSGSATAARTSTALLADASGPPIGAWDFDDCSAFQTQLRDSTFSNNTAFRSVNAACVDGVQGRGVAIANTEDIVYVPDQPAFRFEQGVTLAGWFKPASTSGTRTLIRKRDRDTSSFALVLTGGKFQFVASFGNGRAASVTAPARARPVRSSTSRRATTGPRSGCTSMVSSSPGSTSPARSRSARARC
jgi:hypothetical protein